ncbi:diacylglycerol kinase [Tamaricihabitans halophyticus]|uniref:Diacylglycerol kinase n=1 Tax=Tamaricihabitans halophyticus TaxID=1262583 RepID=A0A4R2QPN7_9PSEU|nr:diacylglycerol kinase family protein [Tamaricihabitans halophyticus]TCP50899.1 diacylglycerol kinase [Tamaricihabitans halophyticus]
MRGVLLVCPGSGDGTVLRTAGSVAAQLRSTLSQLDTVVPSTAAETREHARAAVSEAVDVLVVLGGDGAAHCALQECAGTSTALAVLPAGSGNDLARALGMPAEPLAAADLLTRLFRISAPTRWDLGEAAGHWFATVLCAGFDSQVNARVNRMRWPQGRRRYDLAIIAELASLRAQTVRIHGANGDRALPATLVAVGNTAWYGGGIPICPTADPRDGLLDVTVIGQVRRRELLRILPRLRTGGHIGHPAVQSFRASRIRLGGDNDWLAYADGERFGPLPVDIQAHPAALRVYSAWPLRVAGRDMTP